jgi:hypothetical protein
MGGGLESRCVGRVYGAEGAVHGAIRTVHTTYAATSNALDGGRMCPKHVELRLHQ